MARTIMTVNDFTTLGRLVAEGRISVPEGEHNLAASVAYESSAVTKTRDPESESPDRLSIEKHSPHFTPHAAYIGVRINSMDLRHCVEFCVSGGWVRIAKPGADGKIDSRSAKAAPRSYGDVEFYWRMEPSRQVRRQIMRSAK